MKFKLNISMIKSDRTVVLGQYIYTYQGVYKTLMETFSALTIYSKLKSDVTHVQFLYKFKQSYIFQNQNFNFNIIKDHDN